MEVKGFSRTNLHMDWSEGSYGGQTTKRLKPTWSLPLFQNNFIKILCLKKNHEDLYHVRLGTRWITGLHPGSSIG